MSGNDFLKGILGGIVMGFLVNRCGIYLGWTLEKTMIIIVLVAIINTIIEILLIKDADDA